MQQIGRPPTSDDIRRMLLRLCAIAPCIVRIATVRTINAADTVSCRCRGWPIDAHLISDAAAIYVQTADAMRQDILGDGSNERLAREQDRLIARFQRRAISSPLSRLGRSGDISAV